MPRPLRRLDVDRLLDAELAGLAHEMREEPHFVACRAPTSNCT